MIIAARRRVARVGHEAFDISQDAAPVIQIMAIFAVEFSLGCTSGSCRLVSCVGRIEDAMASRHEPSGGDQLHATYERPVVDFRKEGHPWVFDVGDWPPSNNPKKYRGFVHLIKSEGF